MSNKNDPRIPNTDDGNLTEDILRHRGKGQKEIEAMGELDRGDELFEETLDPKFRTVNSGVHRALWDGKTPLDLFKVPAIVGANQPRPAYLDRMDECIAIVKRHRDAGTLFFPDRNAILAKVAETKVVTDQLAEEIAVSNKVNDVVIQELAKAGYWGALVDSKYGGWGASFSHVSKFLNRMAAEGDPSVAGMLSIHGCIGAVDPIQAFGTEAQKQAFLPMLANGQRLSAFALTEPGAGSDLTAMTTKAVLDGDHWVVTGKKLFISNIYPGRMIGLVVLIQGKDLPYAAEVTDRFVDQKPALLKKRFTSEEADKAIALKKEKWLEKWHPSVLIVDLPAKENEHFSLDRYGIHAVIHIHNYGMNFNALRVPKFNLLEPRVAEKDGSMVVKGDGMTIAYHGLNRGRVALCSNAAGSMRQLAESMRPWVQFRETYGDEIGNREQVQERMARLASLIVGADALSEMCASLLDEGYRGELECIVAKVFGSEALKEAAIELALKTHGGRSFLWGHLVGDNLHDFIAPCIYEGEGGMLSMAEFKGLVKEHGKKYMAPMLGFNPKKPTTLRLKHIPAMAKIGLWSTWAFLFNRKDRQAIRGLNKRLSGHVRFAVNTFRTLMRQVHAAMMTHQMKLADRQLRMRELSMDVQKTVTILATCYHAQKAGDETTIMAADLLCQDLSREISPAGISKTVAALLPTVAAGALAFFGMPFWAVAVGTGLSAMLSAGLALRSTGRKSDAYFRSCVKLARAIKEGKFTQLQGVTAPAILKGYVKPAKETKDGKASK